MRATTDPLASRSALLEFTRDPGVTRVMAQTRRERPSGRETVIVELLQNGTVVSVGPAEDAEWFHEFIESLLGPDRTSGAVTVSDFVGLAVLPPAGDRAVLMLDRVTPARLTPDSACGLPAPAITLAVRILDAGAGIVLAGPYRTQLRTALAALTARFAPSTRVALVHDGPAVPIGRLALRLREASADVLAALGDTITIIDRAVPLSLALPAGPVVLLAAARTPEGAIARLVSGTTIASGGLAAVCADVAPALFWIGDHHDGRAPGLCYEILARSAHADDANGLPLLQCLLATDPESGALVATGAEPVDDALRAAIAGLGRP